MDTNQPLQDFVNELLKGQFAQYVKEAKLGLIDSAYEPIDMALRAGILRGYAPSISGRLFG